MVFMRLILVSSIYLSVLTHIGIFVEMFVSDMSTPGLVSTYRGFFFH